MQFSVIGQWLIDGKSPHTGEPVLETCRIVAQPKLHERCDGDWLYEGTVWSARVWKGINDTRDYVPCRDGGIATRAHAKHRVEQTYAIQPGRGQKAIGRTPPIASIRRQDVREMTQNDAIARGFASIEEYLEVWTRMHDRGLGLYFDPQTTDYHYWNSQVQLWDICAAQQIPDVLAVRPAERYDAWVIRFAAPSGEGSEQHG